MASIHKRGKKWDVHWRDRSGQQRQRRCPDAATAKRVKLEVEAAAALGRDWDPDAVAGLRPEPRLSAAVATYLDEVHRLRAGSTSKLAGTRMDIFLGFLRATDRGKDPPLSVLSRALMSEFYAWLSDREKSTRRRYVREVEAMWRTAAEHGLSVPMPVKLPMPAAPRKRTLAPTWEEMDACVAATQDEWWDRRGGRREPNLHLYRLAVLLRYTGLRVAQVMDLDWRHVDMRRAHLTVESGKSEAEKVGRIVPISPHLAAELATWGRREGWLVPSVRSATAGRERTARQRDMIRCWQRSGARPEVYTGQSHHAWRKGFVSRLKALGADDEAVEYLVGHGLGLRGVYVDPDALPLVAAVALIPKIGKVPERLDAARKEG